MVIGMPGERERHVEAGHRGSGLAQWALVMLPLLIAFEQQQMAFLLTGTACRRASSSLLHVPSAVSLLFLIAIGLLAQRNLRRAGARQPRDERSSDARARFMAILALLVTAFSVALLAAQWMPTLFIHPCQA
jgi:hypothetical protein